VLAADLPEDTTIRLEVGQIAEITCRQLDLGLITPNEARRHMGLL
jgi:hypothetical protein